MILGAGSRSNVRRRIQQIERRKHLPVEPAIPTYQSRRLFLSVGPDKKVCQNPIPPATLTPVRPPNPANQKTRRTAQRFDANTGFVQERIAFPLAAKVHAQLSVRDVAYDHQASPSRLLEGQGGTFYIPLIRPQQIQ